MGQSKGLKFLLVGILVICMCIPLLFAADTVKDRARYSQQTIDTLSREWGGPQTIVGPQIVIPVEQTVSVEKTRRINDPSAENGTRLEVYNEIETHASSPLYVLPDEFAASLTTQYEERYRGIFRVPVYRSNANMRFDFDFETIDRGMAENETILWDEAVLQIELSSNRALRGTSQLNVDGNVFSFDPIGNSQSGAGMQTRLGDPRDLKNFDLLIEFNGAQRLKVAPVGRSSEVTIKSDWPHPSFIGTFLPDNSEISETGFNATWSIPHLARNLPQVSRQNILNDADNSAFGVRFFQPNDFYQKAYRIANYGVLFISLTFLTVLLMESRAKAPVHLIQYSLVGLAQSLFVVLMVAYAEQIGFVAAYLVASLATIGLLTAYAYTSLKLGKQTWVFAGVLMALYAVVYLILQSADYALITGSTLAFMALAGTMFATRNEVWSTPNSHGAGWFAKLKPTRVTVPNTE